MKIGRRGETYNVGGHHEMENIRLVEMICDILDEGENRDRRNLITFVKDRPGHDLRYAIDAGKLKNELGWTPEERFETGLRKTIQWYVENSRWVERVMSGEYRAWIESQYGQN
jgi:dTDP-glucose 4,6-dehydratase